MRNEEQIRDRAELYRAYLSGAASQRAAGEADPELDLLIITLIDKLEALLWVLELAEDDTVPLPAATLH